MNLKDRLKELLAEAGISEAKSAHVVFDNGDSVVIVSDTHPALKRSMEEVKSVKLEQTAEAGF